MTAPNEDMPDDLSELRRQLATVKAEVDALQIAAAGQRRSQWLQASTIVAVIAIIVPLVTWWNGDQQRKFAEQQARRVELAELTQRLSESREAYAEVAKDHPGQQQLLSASLVASLVQADRASELIENIDGGFTGHEHYAVADVYHFGGFLGEAHRVASDGLAVADTDVGRISLLRQLATIEATMSGDVSAVEERMMEALDISQQSDDQTAAWTNYYTEHSWATLLASVRECPAALEHAQKAKNHLDDVSPLTIPDSTGIKEAIDAAISSCLPPAPQPTTAGS